MHIEGRIVVFSVTGCPYCKSVKSILESLDLPYHEINLETYPEQRDILVQLTGKRTVPQIFFNEKHIGGAEELQGLPEKKLDELISFVMETPAPPNAPKPVAKIERGSRFANSFEKKDELSSLVQAMKSHPGLIQNNRYMLIFTYENSFTGEALVTFISERKTIDRKRSLQYAQRLMEKKYIAAVKEEMEMKDDKTLYRLVEDLPSDALNAGLPAYKDYTDATEVAGALRTKILALHSQYLSADGKRVDYKGIAKSVDFKDYHEMTAQLQRVALETLSKNLKLAFFINIYNALVIHGKIKLGFPETLWQRYKFFNNTKYIIGGYEYSLQDIENGVLRSNRKGVGMLAKPFSKSDPRYKTILPQHEPLIHFALVCGAKSCPPIKTYTNKNVMKELLLATTAFLETDDACVIDETVVSLSMIFKWYKEDFGDNTHEMLVWVRDHMADGAKKNSLSALLKKEYSVAYLKYDWGTNSA